MRLEIYYLSLFVSLVYILLFVSASPARFCLVVDFHL